MSDLSLQYDRAQVAFEWLAARGLREEARRPRAVYAARMEYAAVPAPFVLPMVARRVGGRFPGMHYRNVGLAMEGGVTGDWPANER